MALKDAFVNVAQAAATSMARSAVNSVVGGIAAGLKGANLQNNTAVLGTQSRQSPILSYPDDVAVDPMQGHYILFGVRTNEPGKISPSSKKQVSVGAGRRQDPRLFMDGDITKEKLDILNQANIRSQGAANSSLTMTRRPSTRTVQHIALYMPPQVSVSYNANYAETEISRRAESAVGAGNSVVEVAESLYAGKLSGAKNLTKAALTKGVDIAIDGGIQAIIGAANALAPGLTNLIALERGKIITPRMEVMFEGIGRRSFEFSFVMIPKSAAEAEKIKRIVDTFKIHMSPEYGASQIKGAKNLREQTIPDVFDINYMYRDKENSYINKIGTSYLTGMDVQYGGDRYTAHEPDASGSPPPQRTTISLKFTEIELMYRNRVEEGY
jgi:hypothetical protein